MSSVEFTDNSEEVSAALKAALLRGLEKCGLVAEGYAKKLCPVDTGNLRNSITHAVDETAAPEMGSDKITDTKSLDALVEGTYKGLVSAKQTNGANPATPPANTGSAAIFQFTLPTPARGVT